ncbi:MAG: hypothetical protein HY690_10080 [Chloroflexi bacterium]|nr:hypothetical protein [Chloroflexota bacterium]
MASASRLGSAAATFPSLAAAEAASRALRREGFGDEQLAAVCAQPTRLGPARGPGDLGSQLEPIPILFDDRPPALQPSQRWSGLWIGMSGVLGLVAMLANLGLSGLPNLTPGALIGGLVGGALGVLGLVSRRRLEYYLGQRVRRHLAGGGVVVTVLADVARLEAARAVLEQAGGREVRILGP